MNTPGTSPAKIAANQSNSQESTGPKSAAGKSASSKNAFKHGLAAANLYVPESLQPLYREITHDLNQAIRPEGTLEDDAFAQLRNARFQMERILILQAELAQQSAARGLDPLNDPAIEKQWDRLERYHRAAQATFRAQLRELRKLQSERQSRYELFTEDAVYPGLANMRQAFNLGKAAIRHARDEAKHTIHDILNTPLPGQAN